MKNLNSIYFFSQTFPNGSESRFVFKNLEIATENDFRYAEAMLANETATGVDLVGLETTVSTQIESKEKLAKFEGFSALVHKKINEKYSAVELKDLSEEKLKEKMEEMSKEIASTLGTDPEFSDYLKKDMIIPKDLKQWLGLSGLAGFMVAVGSEGKTGPLGLNATSSNVNKLTKGIWWGILAAVATHPVITNLTAWGMRKAGKGLYSSVSVATRAIGIVSYNFGDVVSDPVGALEEVWTGRDKNERAHDEMVRNYASGQAETMTAYAGTEIKGWQKQIEKYKEATTDIDKNTIAETLIPETAEFVARSMPQFLGPVESEQVVRAIEAGNVDATSLSRYSAMIFSGNYFQFFLKNANDTHRAEFLKKFKESRANMERKKLKGYTKEELKSKFPGIKLDGLKLNKMLKKTGIRKALSKPGSTLLAAYLSIWAIMKLFMGGSNTVFNKEWWSDKFNSKGAKGLSKAGDVMVIPLTSIDKRLKRVSKNKVINDYTIKKGKGLLSPSEAKNWKKALSSRDDRKDFIKRHKDLMKKEKADGKKEKRENADITIEELKSCLPEAVRKELYPEAKDKETKE